MTILGSRRQMTCGWMFLWLLVSCSQATTTAPHMPAAILRGGGRPGASPPVVRVHKGPQNALQVFISTIRNARHHLAAAAVARSISILGMYPVDTIKTRIQMQQEKAFRLAGIYKGVGGSLVGQVPYGVLTFGSYEVYKKLLLERWPDVKPVVTYALAAILGDLTGSGWLCPSEVVKQQMQAGMYPSTGQALRQIWRSKGLVGLYEGYFGGVARDVPFRVAQLTSFEVTKSLALRLKARRRARQGSNKKKKAAVSSSTLELSSLEAAVCGAISGSFSAAITAPLDRIKTLLMTDSASYGGSVLSCAQHIWANEGAAGFIKGVGPRVIYIAPSVVIFFVAYEQVQQRLKPATAV